MTQRTQSKQKKRLRKRETSRSFLCRVVIFRRSRRFALEETATAKICAYNFIFLIRNFKAQMGRRTARLDTVFVADWIGKIAQIFFVQ